MATTKRRIPVTLSADVESVLEKFAAENNLSLSQSINLFLRHGLEMAEDEFFGHLADDLDGETKAFKSHDEFWGGLLPS